MALTFVIPVRNDARRLQRCLQSITRQATAGTPTIIVVDNGSVDDSVCVARAHDARVLERPGARVGALRNEGAAAARTDLIAFIDADHELAAGWIAAVGDALAGERVAAAGLAYVSPAETWVQRIYDGFRARPSGIQPASWLAAGNLVVRREAFLHIGGFDPSLEACEDVDFCHRLRTAGFTLMSDSRLMSVHHGDPETLAALFKSELWRGRNNLRVTLRQPSLRSAPSIAAPIIGLAALMLVGLALFPLRSPGLVLLGALVFLVPTTARAGLLLSRIRWSSPADVPRALMVALTYETARALALVVRMPHRRAGAPAA